MTTVARLFRVLQVFSLCFLLFTPLAWAQQSYQDTEDDSAALSQDVEHDSDEDGQRFENDLADIEAQYSQLIPAPAKSTASKDVTNDSDDGYDEENEDEEDE